MKLIILYHEKDENSTPVERFVEECKKHTKEEVNLLSIETKEGAETSTIYGVMDYPATLVVMDNGQLVKDWQGKMLPIVDEVIGYLNS